MRKISSENSEGENSFDSFITKISGNEPFYGNILVKKDGVIKLEKSYGLANIEWDLKNTKETKFLLASVSKQFTAAAIATLVEKGKLSYEDSITKFFPEKLVHPKSVLKFQKITLRDLLGHRAGLLKDIQSDFVNLNKQYKLQELTEQLLKDQRLLTHPYGEYYYSNVGYTLLARIVEIVSRFDFEMYMNFKVFRPLGLKDSGVYHRSKIIPLMATGHYVDEDEKFRKYCCYDSSTNMGSHNLYSTTQDLAKWVEELVTNHKLLKESHLDFKEIPVIDQNLKYFNGLFKESGPEGIHYWHDGFSGGYASRVSFYPEKDLTIVILLNRVNVFTAQGQIESIHKELVNRYSRP